MVSNFFTLGKTVKCENKIFFCLFSEVIKNKQANHQAGQVCQVTGDQLDECKSLETVE